MNSDIERAIDESKLMSLCIWAARLSAISGIVAFGVAGVNHLRSPNESEWNK